MGEQKFCYKYPHPSVTADCVIFGFDGVSIKVLFDSAWHLVVEVAAIELYFQNCFVEVLQLSHGKNLRLKLGILSEAEPRPSGASRRTPTKYRFNAEKYTEMKQKGFRLEF